MGVSNVDAFLYAASVDTLDDDMPVEIVFMAPRPLLEDGALLSSLALFGVSLFIVLVLGLVAGRVVRRFTEPLARLSDAAARLGDDDANARVGVIGGGVEIERLGAAFDEMAAKLAELRRRERARVQEAAAQVEEVAHAYDKLQQTHEELHATQAQLVEASRLAGMAEVATNVLHNVGNVLNTVNVAAEVAERQVKSSKIASLERVVALLPQRGDELIRFVTEDERALKLPALFKALADALRTENEATARELEVVTRSIDHIKNIVRSQQQMATYRGGSEVVAPHEILDMAINLQGIGQSRPTVEVIRDYAPVEALLLDRHRILQVMMNLLSNARHALRDANVAHPRIVVRLARDGEDLRIEVSDNGIGVEPSLKAQIFQHGFTTKPDGHGFGLHSSANAATEMGGSLSMSSNGRHRGATFVLRLPLEARETPAHAA